jgi:hypothetical protein
MAEKGARTRHHDYGWIERRVSLLVVAGWTLGLGLVVSILIVRYQEVPPFEKQIGLWAMLLLGGAIGTWGQRNSNRRLRSVDVGTDGLWFGAVNREYPEHISWGSIERVEKFSYPDRDALYIRGKSGLRIRAGGRTLYIYEHINDFPGLLRTIESELCARGNRELVGP